MQNLIADSDVDRPPVQSAQVSQSTRRSFLMNSIVALPIAAVAVASPSIATTPGTDGFLVDLGTQFDSMVARINEYAALSDELYGPIEEAIWARSAWPAEQDHWSRDDASRYWEARKSVIAEIGAAWEAATNRHEQAYEPCDDLTLTIWSLPADSVMGLGVKAKAAALANANLWDEPFDDLDLDKKSTVSFIEATFAAASLPPPAEYLDRIVDHERSNPKSSVTAVDPAIALAARAVEAWNDFEAKCGTLSDVEERVIDWKILNPRPERRELAVGTAGDDLAIRAGLLNASPDLHAAVKEHKAALAEWEKRLKPVQKETGFIRAQRAETRASARFDEIRDELIETRPTSIAGLRAKASAARISTDEDLQLQIVLDIGVLFGDLDSDEKAVV
jgi:hypothetical protein